MAAFAPADPFTALQARAAGISRGRLRGPGFQTVFDGVFVAAGVPITTQLRARAALAIHPKTALLSHSTAAHLLRIPVPHDPDIHITVPRAAHRRSRPGIRSHVTAHRAQGEVDGLRTSGGAALFCELASTLGLCDLVVAGDRLATWQSASDLRTALTSHRCGAGAEARRAGELVRDGVESPMETRARLLLVFAGFPEPVINHHVPRSDGHYRPDLCWPTLRLAVEYDGQQHRSDLDQWDHDIRRREWFQDRGWCVVTLVARDVYRRPEETIERVYAAWRQCGGAALDIRQEWRRYFPGAVA